MRYTVVLVALLASSSFGASPKGSDGGQGKKEEYRLIDRLFVPSSGVVISTTWNSLPGTSYRIRVSGTYQWGGCDPQNCPGGGACNFLRFGDAEHLTDDCWTSHFDNWSGLDISLFLDGANVDWGAFNEGHTYSTTRQGTGKPFSFRINDCGPCYGDNEGSLQVEIYANAPPLACGPLGAQVIDDTKEFTEFGKSCPRIMKWIAFGGKPKYEAMQAFKQQCPYSKTILRMYGEPGTYATGAELWKARYSALDSATAEQKAAIDYLESDNECDAGPCHETLEKAEKYNTFLRQWIGYAVAAGFRPLIGNISVGNPSGDLDKPNCSGDAIQKFGKLVPAIQEAGKYGGGWGYHGYTPTFSQSVNQEQYYSLRYRRYVECFQAQIGKVPLVLTEAGFDKGGNPDKDGYIENGGAAKYLKWLDWFQGELAKDAEVEGATLFTFAPEGQWSSFRLDPIQKKLSKLMACPTRVPPPR